MKGRISLAALIVAVGLSSFAAPANAATSNPVGTGAALSCTFTFSDQHHHTADYTIVVPGT